jgi:hypothetical protein
MIPTEVLTMRYTLTGPDGNTQTLGNLSAEQMIAIQYLAQLLVLQPGTDRTIAEITDASGQLVCRFSRTHADARGTV